MQFVFKPWLLFAVLAALAIACSSGGEGITINQTTTGSTTTTTETTFDVTGSFDSSLNAASVVAKPDGSDVGQIS